MSTRHNKELDSITKQLCTEIPVELHTAAKAEADHKRISVQRMVRERLTPWLERLKRLNDDRRANA